MSQVAHGDSSMTALDTNVLINLWSSDTQASARAAIACDHASQRGPLCISGPVYAELMGLPGRNAIELTSRMREASIAIDWQFGEQEWMVASLAYQGYVRRRKASRGGIPRRILADFLIGAHAIVRNATLMTLNPDDYAAAYPQLRLISF